MGIIGASGLIDWKFVEAWKKRRINVTAPDGRKGWTTVSAFVTRNARNTKISKDLGIRDRFTGISVLVMPEEQSAPLIIACGRSRDLRTASCGPRRTYPRATFS